MLTGDGDLFVGVTSDEGRQYESLSDVIRQSVDAMLEAASVCKTIEQNLEMRVRGLDEASRFDVMMEAVRAGFACDALMSFLQMVRDDDDPAWNQDAINERAVQIGVRLTGIDVDVLRAKYAAAKEQEQANT